MPDKFLPGRGTTLAKGTTSGGTTTYATFSQRTAITGPSPSVGEVTVTHLDATTVLTRPTLMDAGEISMTCFLSPDDATHLAIIDDMRTAKISKYKLVFMDGGDPPAAAVTFVFDGFAKAWTPAGIDPEGMISFEATFRLTGDIEVS